MSTLRLTSISNQGGTASVPSDTVINGTAKAWVNFNGTGTPAINRSFNVSSITDQGTGYYGINFTNAMSSAFYAVSGSCKPTTGQTGNLARTVHIHWNQTPTVSNVYVVTSTDNNGYEEFEQVYVVIHS